VLFTKDAPESHRDLSLFAFILAGACVGPSSYPRAKSCPKQTGLPLFCWSTGSLTPQIWALLPQVSGHGPRSAASGKQTRAYGVTDWEQGCPGLGMLLAGPLSPGYQWTVVRVKPVWWVAGARAGMR